MKLTDLFAERAYATDKRSYLPFYDGLFAGLREKPLRVLELGVHQGGSLLLWKDYFVHAALIAGLDENPPIDLGAGIQTYQHRIADEIYFRAFCRSQFGDAAFDLIIDDASHEARLTAAAFNVLFPDFLTAGGLYVIEDWLVGYRPKWPDSAGGITEPIRVGTHSEDRYTSHQGGMVGMVKQLVDRLNYWPEAAVKEIRLVPGICVVEKL